MNINGIITRTFFNVVAHAYTLSIVDGQPVVQMVSSDYYTTVNPKNMTEAKRALKAFGHKGFNNDSITVEIVEEEVRAMSLEDFYYQSDKVERGANGRVKSEEEEEANN